MGVKRKGNDPSSRLPTLPSPSKSSDAKQTPASSKAQDSGLQTNLAQMVRSMGNTRYSNGQVKKEKEKQFQQLSDGRTTDESSMIQSQTGGAPKSSPMQAMFLAAGDDAVLQKVIAEQTNRKENMEVVITDENEADQMSDDSEENRLFRAMSMNHGGKPTKKADMALIAANQAALGIKSKEQVQEAKKGQNVELNDDPNVEIPEDKTFGYVPTGSTELPTPGGHEIKLLSKDKLVISQSDGEQDEIELKGDYVIITDRFGEQQSHKLPTSLILDDGTKLTFGQDAKIGITNRTLFAEVSNGGVQRNNRSTLAGGIKEELIDMGFSEKEALKKLEEVGAKIRSLAPDDINIDDLAGFNAADLDYLFRDGEYLVRDSDGTWTTNPLEPTEQALNAMTEGRLEDTVWRMGGFCQEAEDILGDFMEVLLMDRQQTVMDFR